ncbi:MAG: dihydrodipicolinate synthase family protein [Planctomycetaceae bacterium]|nr:dihydrodipicolinate synthase family protein [Planctomycetaceae bacterium]
MQGPIRGLVAATFTPFYRDGSLNLAAIPAMVDFLLSQRIGGLYVLGSTGEGLSLTTEERQSVAEAFVSAAAGRLPVLIQVGAECLTQARQLAQHAAEIGADGISAVCPVYFKPDSISTLVDCMAFIAGGAPKLPFYYYHIPAATGVSLDPREFLRHSEGRIPNLQGIKFTAPQMHDFQACVEFAEGRYDILWGLDEMLLAGLAAGARGAVGSTYNFAAPIYQKLWQAWEQGDIVAARRQQGHAQALVRTFVPYGPRGSQKAIMSLIGQDCGSPRLPIAELSASRLEALRAELQAIGFFEWIGQSPVLQ